MAARLENSRHWSQYLRRLMKDAQALGTTVQVDDLEHLVRDFARPEGWERRSSWPVTDPERAGYLANVVIAGVAALAAAACLVWPAFL